MNVSSSTKTADSQAPREANAPAKRSGSFDRILRMKEAQAKSEQNQQPATEGAQQALASNSMIDGRPFLPLSESENNKSSHPVSSAGAPRSTQIQSIVHEIVSQIRSATNKDGSRSVEIEFDSKTLQGLQVKISAEQGTLSIQFSTQSEQVAALLAQHKPELISALASDGFKTAGISTLVRSKRSGSDRGRGSQRGG
jgi:flagellar hook-length control protein FliK